MEGGGGGGGEVEKKGVEEEEVVVVVKTAAYKNKRDEWSEAAILTLLDAYESKWSLRNRAKLKGSDWEEIALHVSARTTPPAVKNPNQCKNKIESMKKKYRLESSSSASAASNNSAAPLPSSWPFYSRMDQLLKGTPSMQSKVEEVLNRFAKASSRELPNLGVNDTKKVSDDCPVPVPVHVQDQNCERNDGERRDHNIIEGSNEDDNASDDTVPINRQEVSNRGCKGMIEEINGSEEGSGRRNVSKRRKRSMGSDCGLGESIRLLASSVLKIEEGRMDMYRESERLRLETEIKRAEVELKRTEIMARTQLQIAKLFAKRAFNHNDDKTGGAATSSFVDVVVEPNNIVGHGGIMNTGEKHN